MLPGEAGGESGWKHPTLAPKIGGKIPSHLVFSLWDGISYLIIVSNMEVSVVNLLCCPERLEEGQDRDIQHWLLKSGYNSLTSAAFCLGWD